MTKTAVDKGLFEHDLEISGGGEVAGADEAGRGCLAGPLAAAAVVFDYSLYDAGHFSLLAAGLRDSKRLTPRAREELFPLVLRLATRVSVVLFGSATIDRDGLHNTNLRALGDCLRMVAPHDGVLLVDGRQRLPGCELPHTPVIKGDTVSACIAAASVVAKVTRDRVMRHLHEIYPDYGFDSHVGYGTAAHKEAIAIFGYSPVHRRSFNISLP